VVALCPTKSKKYDHVNLTQNGIGTDVGIVQKNSQSISKNYLVNIIIDDEISEPTETVCDNAQRKQPLETCGRPQPGFPSYEEDRL
jgi:hypothetical protein